MRFSQQHSQSNMEQGLLIKGVGSFYEVLTEHGEQLTCKARGSFRRAGLVPTVGDRVLVERQESGYALLKEILPRKNLLIRPAVANIDQILLVVSASAPAPDWMLLDRLIVQAMRLGVVPIPVLNKVDTASDGSVTNQFLSDYHAFDTLCVSAVSGEGLDALRAVLPKRITCFAGQSAVGKSSLLNALFPKLHLAVGGLSEKTERGRHTTRHAELWPYEGGAVLDTPGFSLFETECLEQEQLNRCYPEFEKAHGCRYPDCMHHTEPNCGVRELLGTGDLTEARYLRYIDIAKEHQQRRKHRYD